MEKIIKTEIVISTKPEKVWEILTNFEEYPAWNPFIKSLKGEVKVGSKIKIQLPGVSFTPTVLAFEKYKEFRWLGHLLFKGLFDGEHQFVLIDNNNGTTTFVQSERFKGILVRLFSHKLDTDTKKGFEEMNIELKRRVEQN